MRTARCARSSALRTARAPPLSMAGSRSSHRDTPGCRPTHLAAGSMIRYSSWVEHDRDDRRRDDGVGRVFRKETELPAHARENERELADLRERDRHGEARLERLPHGPHEEEGSGRADEQNDEQRAREEPRRIEQRRRIEEHADRQEKQHRERITHRQRVRCGAEAVVRSPDHHAGEKRAEGHRHAEHLGGSHRDAERYHQHRQGKQLARSRGGHAIEHARNEARANQRGKPEERRHLERDERHGHPD